MNEWMRKWMNRYHRYVTEKIEIFTELLNNRGQKNLNELLVQISSFINLETEPRKRNVAWLRSLVSGKVRTRI